MKVAATKPYFSNEDIKFILSKFDDILKGNSFLSMGKYGSEFENQFSSYIGTKYAVSCNSGTAALELIFRSIGITGKEVILPSNTFIATANAVINAGGIPVFADCDDRMSLSYDDVLQRVTANTKAICHVHIGGIMTKNCLRISEFCKSNNIHFVEDACQAHGSTIKGNKAGSIGDAAAFSFFSTKVMTTGEGGMVTTNDQKMAVNMKSLREFGKVKKGILTNYCTQLGYNWRMLEISALIGLRQLESIDAFLNRRREIAKIYDSRLGEVEKIEVIAPEEKATNNYFKYIVVLKDSDREKVHRYLEQEGVSPSGYVYEVPLHKMPVFREHEHISLPNTERLSAKHICLPIYYSMTDDQTHYVADKLIEAVSNQQL